jgi:hypothetical protein
MNKNDNIPSLEKFIGIEIFLLHHIILKLLKNQHGVV